LCPDVVDDTCYRLWARSEGGRWAVFTGHKLVKELGEGGTVKQGYKLYVT
jgi:hypothetical protein